MKIIKYEDILTKKNIETIKEIITHHGIIIYPTDTLYGIGGNFFSLQAIDKIDALKGRGDMPYSVVVPGLPMLHRLVDTVPEVFHLFYEKLLPGKFTLLFKVSGSIDPTLIKGSDKIGIRIPNVPGILKLVEILNVPLVSTSVNRSGEPPLNDPAAIVSQFSGTDPNRSPALLLDAGPLPDSQGSTILDITETPIKCIRKGDDFNRLKKLAINIIG
ncbi:MAG: threonylcarbamoyl-AMP synthase [Candidatus Aminicenantes bacterium]|nr:MAG: threonylcarbamoyl-AMP synthase [Candidatus Aminicenantes bacterium]